MAGDGKNSLQRCLSYFRVPQGGQQGLYRLAPRITRVTQQNDFSPLRKPGSALRSRAPRHKGTRTLRTEPHGIDGRQLGTYAGPALPTVAAEPETAGGRAHRAPLARAIDIEPVAIDEVVGRRRGETLGQQFKRLATVGGAHHAEAALHGHAVELRLRGREPGAARLARMARDREAEARRRALPLLPLGRVVGRMKDAVVVLYPKVIRRGLYAAGARRRPGHTGPA